MTQQLPQANFNDSWLQAHVMSNISQEDFEDLIDKYEDNDEI
jgi:hypothetical protein